MEKILTNHGFIDANKVELGDYLYEYGTSKMMEIVEIDHRYDERIYDIKYSDKRIEHVAESDLVVINGKMYSPQYLTEHPLEIIIPMERYVVNFGKIIAPYHLDPYSAGAILAMADILDEYVNINDITVPSIDHILNVNNWAVSDMSSDGKYYFSMIGSKNKLTWDDIFDSRYGSYLVDHNVNSPIIPYEYLYGSIETRIKFIKGVFDSTYNQKDTPDTVSAVIKNYEMLKSIQRMLWSMGIMTKIYSKDTYYRLDVIGAEEDYPGFFYDIKNKSRMINTDWNVFKCSPKHKLYIESVEPSRLLYKGDVYRFRVVSKNAIYYSANFLPRVTI